MHRIKTLNSADYSIQKWKNGRGTTSQLLINPQGSQFPLDPFLFRVSSARIDTDSAFSKFYGCDRFLYVAEGGRLRLTKDFSTEQGSGLAEITPGAFVFSGESDIYAQLEGEAVIDYNVIWNREKIHAQSNLILSHESFSVFASQYDTLFMTSLTDGAEVHIHNVGKMLMGKWDSLLIELDATDRDLMIEVNFRGSSAGKIVSTLFQKKL